MNVISLLCTFQACEAQINCCWYDNQKIAWDYGHFLPWVVLPGMEYGWTCVKWPPTQFKVNCLSHIPLSLLGLSHDGDYNGLPHFNIHCTFLSCPSMVTIGLEEASLPLLDVMAEYDSSLSMITHVLKHSWAQPLS